MMYQKMNNNKTISQKTKSLIIFMKKDKNTINKIYLFIAKNTNLSNNIQY